MEKSFASAAITKQSLIDWFEVGSRTSEKLGIEFECFVLNQQTGSPLPFKGDPGISDLLEALRGHGWQASNSSNTLLQNHQGTIISLEPGCALEISTPPLPNVTETLVAFKRTLAEILPIAERLKSTLVPLGAAPFTTNAVTDWLPKSRVKAQRDYFITQAEGSSGLQVMSGICSLQLNFDFLSWEDMLEKYRVLNILAPWAAALSTFAPCVDGSTTPLASLRQLVWLDADQQRVGFPPSLLNNPDFGLEDYIDWILEMPLMFIARKGQFSNIPRQAFKKWLNQELPDGSTISLADWATHMSSVFPDVRLRQYIELRTMDTPPLRLLPSLLTLFTTLVYDPQARKQLITELPSIDTTERINLLNEIARHGLRGNYHSTELFTHADTILEIAKQALQRRIEHKQANEIEWQYLTPLELMLKQKTTTADLITDVLGANSSFSVKALLDNFGITTQQLDELDPLS